MRLHENGRAVGQDSQNSGQLPARVLHRDEDAHSIWAIPISRQQGSTNPAAEEYRGDTITPKISPAVAERFPNGMPVLGLASRVNKRLVTTLGPC